ncbi:MAG: Fic family protein [Ardenticatenaceae bacterium]|nr:Fic family protein [Ardenticatenaceae bacterium]
MSQSHEQAHLADLLSDFAAAPSINPQNAIVLIQLRYSALLQDIEVIRDVLRLADEKGGSHSAFLPRVIHKFLYKSILNNAGQYRRTNEPGNGIIKFGPRQIFDGAPPSQIESEINVVFSALHATEYDPVWRVAAFYQRFVQIHPFYDANGRIGRAIVVAYLDLYGLYMNWENMEKNNQWLKRLNDCHKRYLSHDYTPYLEYHINHWRRFIAPKAVIYSQDEVF